MGKHPRPTTSRQGKNQATEHFLKLTIEMRHYLIEKGLSGIEILVAESIMLHANLDGTKAFPSIDTISELSKVCRRAAIKAINRLVETGVIIRKKGKGTSNTYTIPYMDTSAKLAPAETSHQCTTCTTETSYQCTTCTPTGAPRAPYQIPGPDFKDLRNTRTGKPKKPACQEPPGTHLPTPMDEIRAELERRGLSLPKTWRQQ